VIAEGAPEEDVDRTIEIVLETLGMHLASGAARRLAAELPEPAASAVLLRADPDPDPIDIPAAVAQRLGVPDDDALNRVQAVLRAVAESVPPETLDHVRPQLPLPLALLLAPAGERPTSYRRAGA
jgi:uncharacterized protein (DUF2267 family)